MARKRRQTEIFSMSFLDCMCCGFGAVILFFMIINSHSERDDRAVDGFAWRKRTRLEIEVLEGRKNLGTGADVDAETQNGRGRRDRPDCT